MTDHHIRILLIVAFQAFFFLVYVVALSDAYNTFKKKEYIAAVARPVFLLFVITANAYYVKFLIDEDRKKTYEECLFSERESKMYLERKMQRQKEDSINTELNKDILDYHKEVETRLKILKESNVRLKKFLDAQRRSTLAALIPPSIRAKNPDSLKHAKHLPLLNAAVK